MSHKRRHILISEAEGKPAVCFDTGLEPRSFARTKMSQNLVEKGYVVRPDGSYNEWTPGGVYEHDNQMRVWGKPFSGERLDDILNTDNSDAQTQTVLQSIAHWLKARLSLGNIYTTLNPSAVFISPGGDVFFAPPNLASRCLFAEGITHDFYNCPDLTGLDAAAFCAAVMLYKTLAKSLPYANNSTLYQDMREGIFLPPHLAAPGLNKKLCTVIQDALSLPVEKHPSETIKSTQDIINGMLSLLSEPSLFEQLSAEEYEKCKKEKKSYMFRQNTIIKAKRFAVKNKYPLIGIILALLFTVFVIFSIIDGRKNRPTTAGMLPDKVVYAYYDAFSALDHVFMDACSKGSNPIIKSDINIAASLYAVSKTRQSYENTREVPLISAEIWKENGGELPAPDVFGITNLTLEYLSGNADGDMIMFRANYQLWAPNEHARHRIDTLTLQQDRKKNWQITEIIRTEQ